ncbi:coumaroyl-CoA:anthocyanidin 3-O-glucoside-6''-O-coumaroyltransferase 1-like [Magnolia sinica]|uniref:coumaroyl-CoA:anthocyanidin 3-O-glucoside-6''-O-coumaroyltransferase 1-like n=1 Tax=Magnolia sinica TaxID=86752 RepID=UPI002658524D|nr:coumaroyl-CoA:anthocyanidin 3-O-glucoside-6''-O-coumaroyltransferase 1-like [Magnolia sinica]
METQRNTTTLKVLENCRLAPPPASVPRTAHRLTFFDAMWLEVPPVQRLFFYHFSNPTTTTLLSNLKRSLSLTLQIFYPLAGNLTYSPETDHHEILYTDGDSVKLTIAESNSDFDHLIGSHPRDVTDFHRLAPHLPGYDSLPAPVLALQVTLFPNSGFCIGISVHHAAADGSTSMHFMKSWASFCRSGDAASIKPLPIYDRTQTSGLDWITKNHFREMEKVKARESFDVVGVTSKPHVVRTTFVLSRASIERLRDWVSSRLVEGSEKDSRVSSFVLTVAYVWVCLIKARGPVDSEKMAHLVFAVDCRARMDPPLPVAYFGNCIGSCYVHAKVSDMSREDGVVVAAESIGRAIRALGGDGLLRGAEGWIRKFMELASDRIFSVAGSPRLRVYDTDFGWGKPKKVEVLSIEGTGAMSLAESRDEEGGIEIGLALPDLEMNGFDSLFKEGLKSLA